MLVPHPQLSPGGAIRIELVDDDPPEDDDPDLEADAEARFEHFLQNLAWQLERPEG